MSQYHKQPMGIILKEIWEEERMGELKEAIARYVNEPYPFEIPVKWIVEYNELVQKFEIRNNRGEEK